MNRAIATVLMLCATAFVAACSENYDETCEMPRAPEVERICLPSGDGIAGTCVFDAASECSSSLCVVYKGSDAFCSQTCQTTSECPGGSTCERATPSADEGFCVPAARVPDEI